MSYTCIIVYPCLIRCKFSTCKVYAIKLTVIFVFREVIHFAGLVTKTKNTEVKGLITTPRPILSSQ